MNGRRTKKPPGGGLSLDHCFATQKILERAKGFEPSTPTLARSCSTTELHPHPRDWRRSLTGNAQSYAKCGPRMQQPARSLNRPNSPISGGIVGKSARNELRTLAGATHPDRIAVEIANDF